MADYLNTYFPHKLQHIKPIAPISLNRPKAKIRPLSHWLSRGA